MNTSCTIGKVLLTSEFKIIYILVTLIVAQIPQNINMAPNLQCGMIIYKTSFYI